MSYKPNDTYWGEFTTARFDTGAATDADATPLAIATHNGTDDSSFTLTVTHVDTGRYIVTGTIPAGYAKGDVVQVVVSVTVNSVAGKSVIDSFELDSKRVGDLQDASVSAIQSGLATGAEISALQSHGDSAWATATGFALASVWTSSLANTIATNLDTNVGSRSTFAGGPVASVTAAVTVGGYATGQDPATLVLDVAASSHNASGSIGARIGAVQQAGSAVTLPSNPPGGFLESASYGTAPGWYASPPTAAQIANGVWTDTVSGDFATNGSPGKLLLATGVTVATNNDKSGYALSAAGLDAIATDEPSGSADGWNFREQLLALFGRFFNRATAPDSGNGTLTIFQRDGATTLSTQTIADDGTVQTQGGA